MRAASRGARHEQRGVTPYGQKLLLAQREAARQGLPAVTEPPDWLTPDGLACWRELLGVLPLPVTPLSVMPAGHAAEALAQWRRRPAADLARPLIEALDGLLVAPPEIHRLLSQASTP